MKILFYFILLNLFSFCLIAEDFNFETSNAIFIGNMENNNVIDNPCNQSQTYVDYIENKKTYYLSKNSQNIFYFYNTDIQSLNFNLNYINTNETNLNIKIQYILEEGVSRIVYEQNFEKSNEYETTFDLTKSNQLYAILFGINQDNGDYCISFSLEAELYTDFSNNDETITIKQGWNLKGVANKNKNIDLTHNDCIDTIWTYNDNIWQKYQKNNFNIVNLEKNSGFWVKGKSSCSIISSD